MIKFEHKLENNKLIIVGSVTPKKYRNDPTIEVRYEDVISYCKSNDIPIGSFVESLGPTVCSNKYSDSNIKKWIFKISQDYKKELISKIKNGSIIKEEQKTETTPSLKKKETPSARARASRIAASRKRRAKKNVKPTDESTE